MESAGLKIAPTYANAFALRDASTSSLLDGIAQFFVSALNSIRNYLPNCFTDRYQRSLDEQDIHSLHDDFANRLTRVANSVDVQSNLDISSKRGDAMERSNLIAILSKAKTIIGEEKSGSASKLGSLIAFLNRKTDAELTVGEYAFVSYLLESTVDGLQDTWEEIKFFAAKINTLEILQILKGKAGKSTQRLAKEKIIDALDEKYHRELSQAGYSKIITLDGSFGIKTGTPISIEGVAEVDAYASVDGAISVQWQLDDEEYIAIVKTKGVGLTAGIKADFALAKASAQVKGNRTTGDYKEVRTSREFVTYLLPDFIRDSTHRNDPKIAPYLSRSCLLAHELAKDGMVQDFALWAVTRDEVIDVELFSEENELTHDHNDMLLSLFVSSTSLDTEPVVTGTKIALLKSRSVIADLERKIAKYKERPSSPENQEILGKYQAILEKEKQNLLDMDSSVNVDTIGGDKSSKTIQSRANIVSNVTPAQADLYAYSGKAEAAASVGLDVLGIEDLASAGIAGSYTKKYRTLNDIKRTSPCTLLAGKKPEGEKASIKAQLSRQFDVFKNVLFDGWIRNAGKSGPVMDPNNRDKELFGLLKNDFTFYTNLQVRMHKQGGTMLQDQIVCKAFELRYRAKSKEELLHRMVVANAYLFSEVENDETLKGEMLAFEQMLLSPKLDVDKQYLKQHAYYQENMDFEANEDIYSGEINFSIVLDGVTFKFEYIDRERTHTNQLRDGAYKDVKFSVRGAITNVTELMKAAAKSITLAKGMPPALAKKVLDDMGSVLSNIEATGNYSVEKDYLLRYFKPNAFDGAIPEKLLFYRELMEETFQLGLKGSIPTGLPVKFSFGFGYSDSTIGTTFEEFSSGTFIYALMFGMHQYAITTEDKATFDIASSERWTEIKGRQAKYFRQCFKNYAAELKLGFTDVDSLSFEMDAIECEINANDHLTKAQKDGFANAKLGFQEAVVNDSEDAMLHFEKLMHAYSVHWLDKRAYSRYYKGGYLPELVI